jgi:hypothetical protein
MSEIPEWSMEPKFGRENCSFIDCDKCPYGNTCDASVKNNDKIIGEEK